MADSRTASSKSPKRPMGIFFRPRPAQHEVEVAAVVAPPAHAAATGPNLDAGKVFPQKRFQHLPVFRA